MHLTILTTNKCNLDCHFCSNQKEMQDGSRSHSEIDEILEDHLIEHGERYHMFHLSGGEPMIDKGKLENILSVLLSHSLEKKIHLYTNGSYIDPVSVDVFNQYDNIQVNISIDRLLESERGLMKLLDKDYRRGYLTISDILRIKNKVIRVVAPRELFRHFSYALELAMIQRFFNCPVWIDFDNRPENLNKIGLDDAYQIGEFIGRLYELGVYEPGKISFNKFFTEPCQGECGDILKWDGILMKGCHLESESGCDKLRQRMIPGMYDLISQLVNFNQFEFQSELSDKPLYDINDGYVGERNELIPIRKQLQHEERVNYRYRNNEQILFKEVK